MRTDPDTMPGIRVSRPAELEDITRLENARARALLLAEELDQIAHEAKALPAIMRATTARDLVLDSIAVLRSGTPVPPPPEPTQRPIWHGVVAGLLLAGGGMTLGWIGSLIVGSIL